MKKKNAIVAVLIVVAILGTLFSYRFIDYRKNDQAGQDNFYKALSELRATEPQFDNPCLGTSVLRSYSYSELSKKSIEEIKELAKRDPGSC